MKSGSSVLCSLGPEAQGRGMEEPAQKELTTDSMHLPTRTKELPLRIQYINNKEGIVPSLKAPIGIGAYNSAQISTYLSGVSEGYLRRNRCLYKFHGLQIWLHEPQARLSFSFHLINAEQQHIPHQ